MRGVVVVDLLETRSKHMKGSKERYLLGQKQSANFRGNPFCEAAKRHLKKQLNSEKR